MHRSIHVYAHDADPATDQPAYFISPHEALERLQAGYVRVIAPQRLQLKPPPDWIAPTKHTGLFGEVWRIRSSAHYLVWQMVPIDENS